MNEDREHLSESTWEQLTCGELEPAREAAALEHVERCESCGATWRALRDVRAAATAFDPYLAEPPRRRRLAAWRSTALALAASVLVAVGIGISWWSSEGPAGPPVDRGPLGTDRAAVSMIPEPLSPADGSRATVVRFEWTTVPAASHYVVELLDGEANPIWESDTLAEPGSPWPPEVARAPGLYYWRVIAFREGESSPSPLVRFEVTR